ncbi:hypothetical protein DFJ74DRAFT_754788 [Hyaloraphidium curvatum]|nr:hypothetical protein DFJ74DRAFT_754788 [Hyaloraphidium curvatum]
MRSEPEHCRARAGGLFRGFGPSAGGTLARGGHDLRRGRSVAPSSMEKGPQICAIKGMWKKPMPSVPRVPARGGILRVVACFLVLAWLAPQACAAQEVIASWNFDSTALAANVTHGSVSSAGIRQRSTSCVVAARSSIQNNWVAMVIAENSTESETNSCGFDLAVTVNTGSSFNFTRLDLGVGGYSDTFGATSRYIAVYALICRSTSVLISSGVPTGPPSSCSSSSYQAIVPWRLLNEYYPPNFESVTASVSASYPKAVAGDTLYLRFYVAISPKSAGSPTLDTSDAVVYDYINVLGVGTVSTSTTTRTRTATPTSTTSATLTSSTTTWTTSETRTSSTTLTSSTTSFTATSSATTSFTSTSLTPTTSTTLSTTSLSETTSTTSFTETTSSLSQTTTSLTQTSTSLTQTSTSLTSSTTSESLTSTTSSETQTSKTTSQSTSTSATTTTLTFTPSSTTSETSSTTSQSTSTSHTSSTTSQSLTSTTTSASWTTSTTSRSRSTTSLSLTSSTTSESLTSTQSTSTSRTSSTTSQSLTSTTTSASRTTSTTSCSSSTTSESLTSTTTSPTKSTSSASNTQLTSSTTSFSRTSSSTTFTPSTTASRTGTSSTLTATSTSRSASGTRTETETVTEALTTTRTTSETEALTLTSSTASESTTQTTTSDVELSPSETIPSTTSFSMTFTSSISATLEQTSSLTLASPSEAASTAPVSDTSTVTSETESFTTSFESTTESASTSSSQGKTSTKSETSSETSTTKTETERVSSSTLTRTRLARTSTTTASQITSSSSSTTQSATVTSSATPSMTPRFVRFTYRHRDGSTSGLVCTISEGCALLRNASFATAWTARCPSGQENCGEGRLLDSNPVIGGLRRRSDDHGCLKTEVDITSGLLTNGTNAPFVIQPCPEDLADGSFAWKVPDGTGPIVNQRSTELGAFAASGGLCLDAADPDVGPEGGGDLLGRPCNAVATDVWVAEDLGSNAWEPSTPLPVAAIVGGAVGGTVVLATALVAGFALFRGAAKQPRETTAASVPHAVRGSTSPDSPSMRSSAHDDDVDGMQAAPIQSQVLETVIENEVDDGGPLNDEYGIPSNEQSADCAYPVEPVGEELEGALPAQPPEPSPSSADGEAASHYMAFASV